MTIRRLQRVQVALDAPLDLALGRIDLGGRDIAVAAVDRLEPAAIDGHDGFREEFEAAAQTDEATADLANAWAVVVAEVSDGLEGRSEPAGCPDDWGRAQRDDFSSTDSSSFAISIACPREGARSRG